MKTLESFKKVGHSLRICHYAQVPCKPFIVENIKDEFDAIRIVNILSYQHLFLFKEKIISDYSNMIMVDMKVEEAWESYWNDFENMDWNDFKTFYEENKNNIDFHKLF